MTTYPTEPLPRLAALDGLLAAPAGRVPERLRGLAADLGITGTAADPDAAHDPDAAEPAVPALIAALRTTTGPRGAAVALLLGLLAEAPGERVRAAVHRGFTDYLEVLAERGRDSRAELLALTFLVAHFPQERDAVLAATAGLPLPAGDRARLRRCLDPLDPQDPELTRIWPDPTHWRALPPAEREFDRAWMVQAPAGMMRTAYELDTRSLLAYSGAKALWAAEHGGEEPTGTDPDLRLPAATAGTGPAYAAHLAAMRCPSCEGGLVLDSGAVACTACGTVFPADGGTVDLSLGVGDPHEPMTKNVPLCYSEIRSAFLRWKGTNWGGAVSVQDEDEYLRGAVRPVDGPILDLAAGTGRWTAVLAETHGADRVIALDLSAAMLRQVHAGLPDVATVRGSALNLPFRDASLGAVNIWNALQSLPDQAAAIAEVGRCLRPGGTFTLMTFRPSTDPLYRVFQTAPFGVIPVALSAPEDLRAWLTAAGMTLVSQWTPGSFVFITAVRDQIG
ncbi:methyltransferase domain-containing protein [Dactylosporangium aurantiacum]|uniref:Methyltransferase domain-containing protein n=1 Tax=Dactylosporangium aurantiacum TaxID=35754 RepID=A0A9Q9IRE4_9ACTN|nr:class I SAM-dependent methyltransferase [Dactylosporangium aurantiacum]MDG6110110.1 class I SAM-dependent methyltransferase [Dactylosporangium aurantiacum]UWZ58432.1 methyltransferase domain-containing protein [Dactylosporangium aurantiacum]